MPKHEIESFTIKECNEKLLDFRKKQIRSSEYITLLARQILTLDPKFQNISDKHASLEQCCMAAIDYNDMGTAKKLFTIVDEDFPKEKSNRCFMLQLMQFEHSQASVVQEEREALKKEKPTDQNLIKREVGLLIEQNKTDEAVSALVKHLETFCMDEDAWMCLSDLYIELGNYARAAFCLEEIVMMRAHTAHYHIRLAEIYYTWASIDNGNGQSTKDTILDLFNTAKAHYSYAVRLTLKQEIPNLRAIFGWLQTAQNIQNLCAEGKKHEQDEKKVESDNLAMNFMSNIVIKSNLNKVHQGDTVKDYLLELQKVEKLKL